jgi:glycine/D-amino acid oxidase-like deaminating enzyme
MITQKRDLRTGRSYWLSRRCPSVPTSPLPRNHKTEILIVGAGISGALVAEALSARHRVTIVDRRGPLRGSTPASTALVEYEIDTPLTHLARSIGQEKAARAWQRSFLALNGLMARTRDRGIDAEMERRDNLQLAGNVLDADGLREEADARRAIGLETRFLTARDVRERYGINRRAALLAYDDLALDPRRLTAGYLNAAVANGATIHAPVEVMDIDASSAGILAETRESGTIRADAVIFCTGYEMPKIVPTDKHTVISTYAIATRRQPRALWPEQLFIWEASDPYLYMRTTSDGRIICGGEDEEFADEEKRDALLEKKAATISRKLKKLFPKIDATPEFCWAGAFGSTSTGLPSLGRVPRKPNCYAVLGFGGNGITYSRIAADLMEAEFNGRRDPDADLYAFA